MRETNSRVEALETFVDKSLPFMISMYLSGLLREFLSVPDKLRLQDIDNKVLKELSNYTNQEEE
jgi:hypothetical protein